MKFWPFTLFCALVLFFAYALIDGKSTGDFIGKKLPTFSAQNLHDGNDVLKSSEIVDSQNMVMLNFFASWCASCLAEHDTLKALSEENGIKIYGIAWRDSPEKTKEWLKKHGDFYTKVGTDQQNKIGSIFQLEGVPQTYLINSDGVVTEVFKGPITMDLIKQSIPSPSR
jgi:cytochrome c biogenesis protein CcmG/thiol:disulfide interchange protein DsbE